ncbi:hypothetical protein OGAPHI_002178 [Ogataea philodendri]|uniref:tRNA (adenine(58)-N(1))-methyltransferase catalytic subunit TRM61 n=1 Tax=Ogataea philodendri TaxID=1378263 RepID=A0A9P8PBI4_9ASCO|nr:uncharacterized protein OGAPHI_002178 [Ogataea philodendri]KAH3668424.1 hypothetical protein OGAPHI_002178 [Ogataea philodendri]
MFHHKKTIANGDLVLVYIGRDNLKPIFIKEGEVLQTRYGVFPHDSMIGKPFGSQITSTKNVGYIYLLRPTPELWTVSLPHRTQIVYTPDSSYIVQRMNVVGGSRVIEAGTGSGSFTHAFSRTVGPQGRVFSYEFHEQRYEQAKQEFESHQLENTTLTHRDVCNDGFSIDAPVDAQMVFLDLPSPWEAITHLPEVIAKDQTVEICCFSPCIEQVVKTVEALQQYGWTGIELTEVQAKQWEARKEMVRELDDAIERLRDVKKRQKEGLDLKKLPPKRDANGEEKDRGYNPFGKGRRIQEGEDGFSWQNVSKTGPELKTHTSYLLFARQTPTLGAKV